MAARPWTHLKGPTSSAVAQIDRRRAEHEPLAAPSLIA
jgi:hypothetical protein